MKLEDLYGANEFPFNKLNSKQAGAELGQAQLPIGIGLYCD